MSINMCHSNCITFYALHSLSNKLKTSQWGTTVCLLEQGILGCSAGHRVLISIWLEAVSHSVSQSVGAPHSGPRLSHSNRVPEEMLMTRETDLPAPPELCLRVLRLTLASWCIKLFYEKSYFVPGLSIVNQTGHVHGIQIALLAPNLCNCIGMLAPDEASGAKLWCRRLVFYGRWADSSRFKVYGADRPSTAYKITSAQPQAPMGSLLQSCLKPGAVNLDCYHYIPASSLVLHSVLTDWRSLIIWSI